MKSILLITPFYPPNIGGVETHLKYLARHLSKHFSVDVVTYQPLTNNLHASPYEIADNLRIKRIKWFRHLFYRLEKYPLLEFLYLFPALFIYSFIHAIKHKPDVIYGNGLVADLIAVLIGKIFRKKCVTSTHTDYKLSKDGGSKSGLKNVFAWIFKNSDHIFAVSRGGKEDIVNLGVSEDKISIIKYWMDTDEFKPMQRKNRPFTVLYIARFVPVKDVDLIVKTAYSAKNVNFIFIGDGPLRPIVEKLANEKNYVKYLGFVPLESLNKYYNEADVLLWGSVEEDNLVLATIGALSCGLPVIIPASMNREGTVRATKKDIVPKGVGFIIESDVNKILSVLYKMRDDEGLLEKMSKNARKFTVSELGEKNGEIISTAINNLINKKT